MTDAESHGTLSRAIIHAENLKALFRAVVHHADSPDALAKPAAIVKGDLVPRVTQTLLDSIARSPCPGRSGRTQNCSILGYQLS